MTTAAQEFADELAELRAETLAEMKALRRERRALIDICVAHNDVATLEAILAYLERTCCAWERWPAFRE